MSLTPTLKDYSVMIIRDYLTSLPTKMRQNWKLLLSLSIIGVAMILSGAFAFWLSLSLVFTTILVCMVTALLGASLFTAILIYETIRAIDERKSGLERVQWRFLSMLGLAAAVTIMSALALWFFPPLLMVITIPIIAAWANTAVIVSASVLAGLAASSVALLIFGLAEILRRVDNVITPRLSEAPISEIDMDIVEDAIFETDIEENVNQVEEKATVSVTDKKQSSIHSATKPSNSSRFCDFFHNPFSCSAKRKESHQTRLVI